jgi:plastocyanin
MSRIKTLIRIATIPAAMLCVGVAGLHAQVEPQATPQTMAQLATLHGRIEIVGESLQGSESAQGKKHHRIFPETVVWLTPTNPAGADAPAATPNIPRSDPANPGQIPQLVQKNKTFIPHILVVPAGSLVEFPNRDPFFHNVFSLFEGKRFDLGLYEAGSTRMVRFDRPGISYIFCNIHPEMNAVIITMATPLFAISNSDGQLTLPSVPYGRYKLHVWSEGMDPETAPAVEREITVTGSAVSLGIIRVPPANGQAMAHTNKYGREYDDPTPNNSVYEQQR